MKFSFKKILFAFFIISALTCFFASCSNEKNSETEKEKSENVSAAESIDLEDLKEKMLKADESLPSMSLASSNDENGEELFSYLAEYDYENVEDYFFSYAAQGTAEEIAVIRLIDEKHTQKCAEAVKEHVENRIIQFETYDPTQVPRCEEAVVFSNDVYVVLIICDNDDAVKDAFYDAFE